MMITGSKYSTKQIFEELPVGRSLTELALPAIAGQLIVLIYNMADTFFVGRVNDPLMMSATALTFPVFALTIPLSIIAGTGGGSLVSRLLGKRDEAEARRVGSLSIYISLIFGVLYSLLIFIFMDPLLVLLGAGDEVFLFTKQYMSCVVVLGGAPNVLAIALSNLLRSVGHSKEAGLGVSAGGILNIILDPLLMFVILPRGNEVLGAGLATAISNIFTAVYFIITVLRLKGAVPLSFDLREGLPSRVHIFEIFSVGVPSALTTLLFDLNNIVMNRLMSNYGDIAIAAIGMTIKIERLSLNICVGLCLGMSPLVAYNYAAGNYERMTEYVRCTRRRGVAVSLISIALYEIFAEPFIQFFIKDPATVLLGAAFLRRRAVASVFMFLSFYMVHFFQGIGSGRHTFWLSVIRYVFLCLPALFILEKLLGMYGLAWAQAAGDVVNTVITAVVYKHFLDNNINIRRPG